MQFLLGEDSELDNLRKLLNPFKCFGCPIYFIPGNHDSDELLQDTYLEEGFINIHKNHYKYEMIYGQWVWGQHSRQYRDLSQGYNKQGLIWQGYPYKSDEEYSQDLGKLKLPEEGKIILITHIGPALSQTTICSDDGWDDVIKSGSDSQSNLIKNKKNIILNVHGHTHDGVGSRMISQCKVVNVGPLLHGNYCIIRISNKVDKIEHIFI